jgi:hypothetical protein
MPLTNTDAIIWYNVGIFGDAGYAVPNWSNDIGSLNPQILDWTDLVGRNLFYIMHHEDADLRIPPSINTLKRVHKLYLRAGSILAGRAVPPGENNMEVLHARRLRRDPGWRGGGHGQTPRHGRYDRGAQGLAIFIGRLRGNGQRPGRRAKRRGLTVRMG